ncbi:MAG: hypothetical protein Q7R49_02935 [Candidatus Daviesbacteria bacterium]|nr:hypothetical protein [Candidatus Daviesbacteria bacterium]
MATNSQENPLNPEVQKLFDDPVTQPYAEALHITEYTPEQQRSLLAVVNAQLGNFREALYYPYIQKHLKKLQEGSGLGKKTVINNVDGMRAALEENQGFFLDPNPRR